MKKAKHPPVPEGSVKPLAEILIRWYERKVAEDKANELGKKQHKRRG